MGDSDGSRPPSSLHAAPWPTSHRSPSGSSRGDKRALARAISLVEDDDPEGWALVREVYPQTGTAAVVGFTGPPGAGKSTLISALMQLRRAQDRQVAVLSIDPSLAVPRRRAARRPHPALRALPRPGRVHPLDGQPRRARRPREAALQTALLMDAAGKDDVFLETVGVGQAEVDVIDHADTVVLVLIPGSGDSIQALKAGRHGDPRRDRRQQGRPPADRHDGPRDPGRATLAPAGGLARPDRQDRGRERRGRRGARGQARRAPRLRRGRGHARGAPPPQPAQRGPRDRDRAAAPRARGVAARRRRVPGAARRGRRAQLDPASAASAILERFDAGEAAQSSGRRQGCSAQSRAPPAARRTAAWRVTANARARLARRRRACRPAPPTVRARRAPRQRAARAAARAGSRPPGPRRTAGRATKRRAADARRSRSGSRRRPPRRSALEHAPQPAAARAHSSHGRRRATGSAAGRRGATAARHARVVVEAGRRVATSAATGSGRRRAGR